MNSVAKGQHLTKPGRSGGQPSVPQRIRTKFALRSNGKVTPCLIYGRVPRRMTWREFLQALVFKLGQPFMPCYPCHGAACTESWCEYHPKEGAGK